MTNTLKKDSFVELDSNQMEQIDGGAEFSFGDVGDFFSEVYNDVGQMLHDALGCFQCWLNSFRLHG